MSTAKRYPGVDLIRIFAFFCLVSLHFFLNNDYYYETIRGERMYIMTLMRSFFIVCVPLFMTLTGYLLNGKKMERAYYKRISKIIITYLLASILCIVYSVFRLKQELSVKDAILNILNFTAAPYSWYVEMYLGMYLLIPLLNIVYHAMPSQKAKLWLIFTFIILTVIPSSLNIYDLRSFGWLSQPSSTAEYNKLFPSFWTFLYPITYYYIGSYLKEYGFKINRLLNIGLILFLTIFSGTNSFWRSYQANFVWGFWCGYGSPLVMSLAVLVFVFFININYTKLPNCLVKFLHNVSVLCLGAYLVSWIFDSELYPVLLEKVPVVAHRLESYIVIVPILFVASLITSYFLSKVQFLIEKAFALLGNLVRKKAKTS